MSDDEMICMFFRVACFSIVVMETWNRKRTPDEASSYYRFDMSSDTEGQLYIKN